MATPHCRSWERHRTACALTLAADSAGSSNAARMAIIAITTSNSISVNAGLLFFDSFIIPNCALKPTVAVRRSAAKDYSVCASMLAEGGASLAACRRIEGVEWLDGLFPLTPAPLPLN